MSDRKESLLRTIKLQYEQLEEWETKRSLYENPDEKKRCELKIDDIKALIKEKEDELKKLKGGVGKQVATPPVATDPVLTKMTYSKIGFNAHKDFSENKTNENIKDGIDDIQKIGDEYDPNEINIPQSVVNTIASKGNYLPQHLANTYALSTNAETETEQDEMGQSGSQQFTWKTPQYIISFILWASLTFLMFMRKDIDDFLTKDIATIALGSIITGIAIIALYKYLPVRLQLGSKFLVSIMLLIICAGVFFWKVIVFGVPPNDKTVGEVIILPAFIAALFLLIERNWKKSH